jgi:preprotein translocase subunit YajC
MEAPMDPQQLAFYAVLGVGLWLLLIRPQRARAKAAAQIQAQLAVGACVMTTAGIHGTVIDVDEDDGTLLLEISPGVPVRFASAAVVRIIEPAPKAVE